jgi:hypothetical protein
MAHLTEEEKQAIDAWLKKNKPVKYPTGYSSVYDEYGNKRVSLKFRMAGIAKRIRASLKKDPSLTYFDLAAQLTLPFDDVVAVCKKHNIEVKDGSR